MPDRAYDVNDKLLLQSGAVCDPIAAPTLVITGDSDRLIPAHNMDLQSAGDAA